MSDWNATRIVGSLVVSLEDDGFHLFGQTERMDLVDVLDRPIADEDVVRLMRAFHDLEYADWRTISEIRDVTERVVPTASPSPGPT